MFQLHEIGKIYNMAKELHGNDLCANLFKKITELWECDYVKSKIVVQIVAQIDYGMVVCKVCFNLEGDSDGLSFVTAA